MRRRRIAFVLQLLVLWTAASCNRAHNATSSKTIDDASVPVATAPQMTLSSRRDSPSQSIVPRFTDMARELGVDFTFFNDAVPGRYFLPEVMGGGAGWLDFDMDGTLDLYLRDGCNLRSPEEDVEQHFSRLYRGLGERFHQVTHASTAKFHGYGQGCAVGDFDCDGFPDLYLVNFGEDALLHNLGDGTFEDVTTTAEVGDKLWGSSAVWLDIDGDSDLDIYVVNYMDVSFSNYRICNYDNVPGYCGPGDYSAVDDVVYLNAGDGHFVESGEALGFKADKGKGLAVVALDFDLDLLPEIFVANDMAPKFLFTRRHTHEQTKSPNKAPLYHDVAVASGCAVSDNGQNEASMGISASDFDGDGFPDIYLTHFYQQKNTLYHNLGNLLFADDSRRTRVAACSFEFLGFGTVPFDFNRDGRDDLFVANGHVLGPEQSPNAMRPQLLLNDGRGRFDDISDLAGPYFRDLWLGRCAASGDYDEDGDLDILITHLNRPVTLLRNETKTDRHFIGFDLRTYSRIPPIGGRVVVTTDDLTVTSFVKAGGSYLASNDPRLLVGLGNHLQAKVQIYWPSGRIDEFANLDGDRYWRIYEGQAPESLPVGAQ